MAQRFAAIDQVFDPGLILPINGREYRIADPPAEIGLYCQRIMLAAGPVARAVAAGDSGDYAAAETALQNISAVPPPPGVDPGTDLEILLLGDAYPRMIADGVSTRWIKLAGMTVLLYATAGDETAAAFWAAGGRPEPQAPNRAARRKTRTSSTAAATATRSRGSSSGTSSRIKSNPVEAPRSAGTTSSPAGT